MKVAYITPYDSADIHAWSGSGYHIRHALERAGLEIAPIGPLPEGPLWRWGTRFKKLAYRHLLHREYLRDRQPGLVRTQARAAGREIDSLRPDALFFPGSLPLALLNRPEPAFYWADATFAGHVELYAQLDQWAQQHLTAEHRARLERDLPIHYNRLCRETLRHGNELEQRALSRARLAIFSSQWAAGTALRHYDVDPAKVKVVPFGANIECRRTPADIEALLARRPADRCRLLFLGVEWYRKGGDQLLAIARELQQRRFPVEVHLVGCHPPEGEGHLPEGVNASVSVSITCHGYLSKKIATHREKLDTLLGESHFLVLPTRAECLGVAMAEASSFGVPSLVGRVGGTPEMVREGVNGWTFPLTATPQQWADRIQSTFEDRNAYAALARSSFQEYTARLNWSVAGRRVRELMEEAGRAEA